MLLSRASPVHLRSFALAACVLACVATMPCALGGCVMPPAPPRNAMARDYEAYTRAFLRSEPILLRGLARADARFARRLRETPSPRFVDPFMFDARAQAIEYVVWELTRVVLPAKADGEEARVLARHRLEEELLYQLIAEERLRLHRERNLARSSASLVAGLAETWPTAYVASHARQVDSVLAWRLDQVKDALSPNAMSEMDRVELREALEALSIRVAMQPLPRTELALARLRGTLDAIGAAPFAIDDWEEVAIDVHAHLGVVGDREALAEIVSRGEVSLREQAAVGLAALPREHGEAARRRAGALLFAPLGCPARAEGTVVRSLAPPPERAAICAHTQLAASAASDVDEIVALVVLHDAAVVGGWALAMQTKIRDPRHARANGNALLSVISAEREARLLRLASTHPTQAIGAALSAALLVRFGASRVVANARAWASFGDAPLDVVERELFASPAKSLGRGSPATFELVPDDRRVRVRD